MITTDQIALYWTLKFRPPVRTKGDQIAADVQVHSRKVTPDAILDAFRPNETAQHKQYRKSSYQPRTYGWFNKVLQQFVKIRRAEDWRVEWPAATVDNPLRDYTQQNFGEYTSFENWYFGFYLRNVIDDPNGALVFLPNNIEEILTTGRLNPAVAFTPVPFYFPSKAVRDYTPTLLVIDAQEPYRDPATGNVQKGAVRQAMYLLDADEIVKLVETGDRQNPTFSEYRYQHGLGFTALANGGLVLDDADENNGLTKTQDGRTVYDSFIAPAMPFWADAIALESDHKVNLALHIHPKEWELATAACTYKANGESCKNGRVKLRLGRTVTDIACPQCSGTGQAPVQTPFGRYLVQPFVNGIGEKAVTMPPTPPFGYGERPVEQIKTVKELADAAIWDGLAALNLEMLGETGLNQSGKAKDLDRQEIDTYVTLVSDWSIDQILTNGYYFMARWLFPGLSDDQLKKYLPAINKPRKFDLVTTEVWAARVAAYKKDGAAATTQAEAEIKLAERQYGADSAAFKRIKASILLDPLYGQSAADKELVSLAGGCSREDYIISSKIGYMLTRALSEKANFYDIEFADQVALLLKFAQETLAPAGSLGQALNPPQPGQPPIPGQPQPQPAPEPTPAPAV